MGEKKKNANKTRGYVFLTAWLVLILAGIFDKRLLGHTDMMVFFHLPAAVFLVLSCYELSADYRAKYRQSLQRYRSKPVPNVYNIKS